MKRQRENEPILDRSDAGFGLVSVMVAIVLLSVGILSLAGVLTQSISMHTTINLRTTGLDLARSYMEDVRGRDPLTLVSEAMVRVNERGEVEGGGAFTRELTIEAVALHLMEATVIVTSPQSNPVKLVTWIYDGVY